VNVELVGVNRNSDNIPAANFTASYGKTLPWLQDTQTNVWALWSAEYRDVIILDSSNRVVNVMNLTFNDLSVANNRDRLKEILRNTANAGDSDGDKLPDHWEYRYLGGLQAEGEMDSDNDGFNNFMELAFGSNPQAFRDIPRIQFGFNASRQFTVSFDRWAGSAGEYLVETSTDLMQWSGATQVIRTLTTGLFDGTGRARNTHNLTRNSLVQKQGVIRVNARPKP